MPFTTRTCTMVLSLAAVGASAVPALAAERAAERGPFDAVQLPLSGPAASDRDAVAARQRKRARAKRRGPYRPVVGSVDHGSGDARFGAARSGHVHAGQDMFAPAGRALVAADDGVVAEVGSDGGQGNYAYLYDPKRKLTYVYMHMARPADFGAGTKIRAGERIGAVGCTGSCWGDHLHFEIRAGRGIGGAATDPMPKLRQWERIERPR